MAFNEKFMQAALKEAQKAMHCGEAPIGAVVVYKNEIIGFGANTRETENSISGHAEINALKSAARHMGGWQLDNCDLYVTLEPCPMCAGAIIQSHIRNLYFGARDEKAGACGSRTDLFVPGLFNHETVVFGGVLENECATLLKAFFIRLRKQKDV